MCIITYITAPTAKNNTLVLYAVSQKRSLVHLYSIYWSNYTHWESVLQFSKKSDDIDQSYYVTVSYLLNLLEYVADIFKVAKVNEKRQILGLLLSNLEFDGKNANYTFKES